MDNNCEQDLSELVRQAAANRQPLNITGGNSKAFYGRTPSGTALDITGHAGIVSYEPSELVLTARAGTQLHRIQALLNENSQMLGFEPAFCTAASTLGGVIAAGLAGPRRPYAGAVRDFVLGVRMINGAGEILNFGGQVMKNVAGFDHSRLMAGALGTLGVLLEVSLRVVPAAETEHTRGLEGIGAGEAIERFNLLAGRPLPLSAAAWAGGRACIRLSGTRAGVARAAKVIGGEEMENGEDFWHDLCDHQLAPLSRAETVFRFSLPPAIPQLGEPSGQVIDWGGAQRWGVDEPGPGIYKQVKAAGGHICRFRGGNRDGEVFAELHPKLIKIIKKIKQAFDPKGILNPGRMYRGL